MSDFDDAIGDMTSDLLTEAGTSCVYLRGTTSTTITLRKSTGQPYPVDAGNGMILEVRPSNAAAVALYQKIGYEQIGIRKNYYPADPQLGAREDALVMAKSIKLEA